MGRSRMRGTPSSRYVPATPDNAAVRNRMVVPLFAQKRSADDLGNRPPPPVSSIDARSKSTRASSPSVRSASTMTRVSSLSRAPRRCERPCAKAAQISARFVILFEPGGRIEAERGPRGVTARTSSDRSEADNKRLPARKKRRFASGVRNPIRRRSSTNTCRCGHTWRCLRWPGTPGSVPFRRSPPPRRPRPCPCQVARL